MGIIRPLDKKHDFTLKHYTEILHALKQNHSVLSFKDVHELGDRLFDIEKFVIMRHDVEFSLSSALNLARIDHAAGIRSTFFLLYSSDYNIFEEENALIIQEILDLGHDIGLHYDAALIEKLNIDPSTLLKQQIHMMETFWRTKIYAMSSHMPMRSGMTFEIDKVIDVYDQKYLIDIKYITDSTQAWREEVISDMLQKYSKIHLLLHEFIWSDAGHDWDSLLLIEAKQKLDSFWNRALGNIERYKEGLTLRKKKDAEFKNRFMQVDNK